MDLITKRVMYRSDGIFSGVQRDDATKEGVCVTVEHAFQDDDNKQYYPLLQPGEYVCQRGMHRLKGMTADFETFEVIGVIDMWGNMHSGILFPHNGNWGTDSEGCACCGESFNVGPNPADGKREDEMVTNSRDAFKAFMQLQAGVDQFKLTVIA